MPVDYQFLFKKECEQNKQLKKQIESMRNCFNCASYKTLFENLNGCTFVLCYEQDGDEGVYAKITKPICQHWKQKEVQDGE